jgi:hypothetical protein
VALWKLADEGRADFRHDRRFSAFVLVATLASLRWGEAIALRRCDLDPLCGEVASAGTLVKTVLLGTPLYVALTGN